jgi:hypothetical protein
MSKALSEVIRQAILESGESRYSLSIRCGVDQGILSRFMNGKGGMGLETIDKLVAGLGIAVRLPRKRKDK